MPLQMSEQNSHGRGITDPAYNSDIRPSWAGRQFLSAYKNQCWLLFYHAPPGSHKTRHTIPAKRGCCQERLHPHNIISHLQFYLWFIAFNICPAAAFCSGDRDVQLSNTSFRSGVNSTISPSAKNWDKVMP